ncbi:MAG TPA: ABC transporter permease subunit [Solirubrobacteraceae bacterium]|nr:ABC transporter permease subunit [Solirubrobacteraceae bacterium]
MSRAPNFTVRPRSRGSSDDRAEHLLGAIACLTFVGIVLMVVFVTARAAPTFAHNGLSWLGSGGNVDTQIGAMVSGAANVHVRVWPLIYGSLLTSALAVLLALAISLLTAIFIVDLAPRRVRRLMLPVIRLLASVPSVIYGLIGILVLVPFVGNDLITTGQKESVFNVIQLTGAGLLVSVVILTVMVTPIITALTIEALASVPRSWHEGAVALGLNPVRATITVSLRAIRPAIVAATALAAARALGEAIAVDMVSGGKAFSPNPADGLIFIYEPLRTAATTIIDQGDNLSIPSVRSTVYALALLLMFSGFLLSVASRLIRRSLRKYELSS